MDQTLIDPDALVAVDRQHLWHPYATSPGGADNYLVESAQGTRLRLRRQDEWLDVVDAMSSWWCAIHGYAVPELDRAAHDQLAQMSHVMFGGLTHRPAAELASMLVDLAPGSVGVAPSPLQHVFFADSGSVSVEVAMKMAWQAEGSAGLTRRRMFTIRGGYHGDTFSPMSVCDPEAGMHAMYGSLLPRHVFAPQPPAGLDRPVDDPELIAWEAVARELFARHAADIAAVIIEPVLQGAGGMYIYSPHVVKVLADLASEHGALLIFDEIATGFWRTGTRWAADRCDVVPDILCVGKALTGGYLSLAAVLCTAEVAARVAASPAGAMMHGPTFMANPLACAVAAANLRLLSTYEPALRVARISAELSTGLAAAAELRSVVDVRVLGAVGVVELSEPVRVREVTEAALDAGVWVRPFRNLVYTMPPYVSTPADIATITSALVSAVGRVHG
ncbi:MAG TPA: adenosylmethionine--8-amino-7-oxononanoate transaminase [Propionibacteriaceae bacterium]|nr:adenosylmethionine--8-amino-7-oxononanoate transaminase [Propionibacteriaceae bacterium]